MASKMSNDGFQMVEKKRYIPLHLRGKESKEESTPQTLNMDSTALFPTLGNSTALKTAWGGEKSFKKTIEDLIAYEQLTEQERLDREEAARAMEGFAVLSLKVDKERIVAFNNMIAEQTEDPDTLYMTMLKKNTEPSVIPVSGQKYIVRDVEVADDGDDADSYYSDGHSYEEDNGAFLTCDYEYGQGCADW